MLDYSYKINVQFYYFSGVKITGMLYNKKLQISAEDILHQKDIALLLEWSQDLHLQILQVKEKMIMYEEGSASYIRATDAKRYMNSLREIIASQIKYLRLENNKEILLMRKFMKAAKAELTKEQYKLILEKAKELAHFND